MLTLPNWVIEYCPFSNSNESNIRTLSQAMEGRSWDPTLLEDATSLILQDLPLAPSAPGGMVEYRRALTVRYFVMSHPWDYGYISL